jgi:glycine cleavage system aminomethyltransferase T
MKMSKTQVPAAVARTPFHHWHAAHGARFAEAGGWQVVTNYADPRKEAGAAGTDLSLADISAFPKISLRGQGVPALVPTLAPGRVALSPQEASAPGDRETHLCRLTADHLLWLAEAPGASAPTRFLGAPGVVWIDVTSAFAGLRLQGPRVAEFLARLTHLDVRLASFPPGSCAETGVAGVEAMLVRPGGRLPALVDVYVSWDLGQFVWERMLEVGRPWQITAVAAWPITAEETRIAR